MTRKTRGGLTVAIVALFSIVVLRGQLLPEKTPSSKPKPKRTPSETKPAIQEPEMVNIPGGEFRMGSKDGGEDERPVHSVYISEFYTSKYPISNAEYKVFVDLAGYRPPASREKGRPLWNGRDFPAAIARQPVVKVSWDDAAAYCRWLAQATGKEYRLPTEAEWEKAARGGLDQKTYPWGDEEAEYSKAWFGAGRERNGLGTLKDVDYGFLNGYGLYGMAGNTKQWTADLYNAHYYVHSSPRDPLGPFGGLDRVVRGSSAFDEATRLRCASRGFRVPTDRSFEIGFRVVRK